jgi:predicted RecA/RadA family phage recombinase
MAQTFVSPGDVIEHTAGSNRTAGVPFQVGSIVVVPLTDIASGEVGPVATAGRFVVPKVAGSAWTFGEKLNFDVGEQEFADGAAGTGDIAGCAYAAAAAESAATTGEVILTNPGTIT